MSCFDLLGRFFVDGKAWFSAGCEQQDFAFVEQMVRREFSKVQLSANDPQRVKLWKIDMKKDVQQ